jgi:hypothetical protein
MAQFLSTELLNIVYESQIRGEVEDIVGDLVIAVEHWHHEEETRIRVSEFQKVFRDRL